MTKVIKKPRQWEIVQIQIAPDHQGVGIGSMVMHSLMHEAETHAVPLTLSVLKVNPARSLCKKLGFSGHAQTPPTDELFWWPLTQPRETHVIR